MREPSARDDSSRSVPARSPDGLSEAAPGATLTTSALTTMAVLGVQRSAGNAAIAALLSPRLRSSAAPARKVPLVAVQRSPDKAKATWDPPHFYEDDGLIPVTDHYQARNNLYMTALTLESVANWKVPAIQGVLNKVNQARGTMPETGDLTQDEVNSLDVLHTAALMAYQVGTKQMQDTIKDSLAKYKEPEGMPDARDQVAEFLHQGFTGDRSTLTKANIYRTISTPLRKTSTFWSNGPSWASRRSRCWTPPASGLPGTSSTRIRLTRRSSTARARSCRG